MDETNIVELRDDGIVYIDDEGVQQFIDFEACYQRYIVMVRQIQGREPISGWKEIARRDIINRFVTFHTEPPTRFDFSTEEAWQEVVDHVYKIGWHTFDLT